MSTEQQSPETLEEEKEALESANTEEMPSPEEEQEALIRRVVHTGMLGDWRESEMGSLRFRLFEHEYDVPVEQEDKRLAVNTVMRSLKHFFVSDTLDEAASYRAWRDEKLSAAGWPEPVTIENPGALSDSERQALLDTCPQGEVLVQGYRRQPVVPAPVILPLRRVRLSRDHR